MFVFTFLQDRSHFIRCKNMKKLTNYQGKPQYSTFFYAIIVCFRENYHRDFLREFSFGPYKRRYHLVG